MVDCYCYLFEDVCYVFSGEDFWNFGVYVYVDWDVVVFVGYVEVFYEVGFWFVVDEDEYVVDFYYGFFFCFNVF